MQVTTMAGLVGQRRTWQQSLGNGWTKPVPVTVEAVLAGNRVQVRDDKGRTHTVKWWNLTSAQSGQSE